MEVPPLFNLSFPVEKRSLLDTVMFRTCLTLLTVLAIIVGGIPSVTCLGDCRFGGSSDEQSAASCCAVKHGVDGNSPAKSAGGHPGGGCCCKPHQNGVMPAGSEEDAQSQGEKVCALEAVRCGDQCGCCVVATPVVSNLPSEQSHELLAKLAVFCVGLEGWNLLTTVSPADLSISRLSEPWTVNVRDVPLNIRLCVWTV